MLGQETEHHSQVAQEEHTLNVHVIRREYRNALAALDKANYAFWVPVDTTARQHRLHYLISSQEAPYQLPSALSTDYHRIPYFQPCGVVLLCIVKQLLCFTPDVAVSEQ